MPVSPAVRKLEVNTPQVLHTRTSNLPHTNNIPINWLFLFYLLPLAKFTTERLLRYFSNNGYHLKGSEQMTHPNTKFTVSKSKWYTDLTFSHVKNEVTY